MGIFKEISSSIVNFQQVYSLADDLLENIEKIGGRAWINAKKEHGGNLNHQVVAYDVLEHWCNKSRHTPYGGRLYDALRKSAPRVAEEFEKDLEGSIFCTEV